MNFKNALVVLGCLVIGACASPGLNRVDQANIDRQKWRDAADNGDPEAQYQLGNSYCCGSGFFSTPKAIEWWCRAAANGHREAGTRLKRHQHDIATCPAPVTDIAKDQS